MLVHWDFSNADLLATNQQNLLLLTEEIVRARRQGNHVISVSRNTVEWLIENLDLSSHTKSQLISLKNEYAQTGNLKYQASFYVDILNSPLQIVNRNGSIISASISFILNSSILDYPHFVVENIDNDGWLFEFIIQNVRSVLSSPAYRFQLLHGGGVDVLRVLKHATNEKKIVCLVADSDRKHPKASEGGTTKKAREFCDGSGWPLCFVYSLPCHEVENLLPFTIVAKMAEYDAPTLISLLHNLSDQEEANACPPVNKYWRWFDIKNGLSEKTLPKKDVEAWRWHVDKLNIVGLDPTTDPLIGFGDKLIPRIRNENKHQSELRRELNRSSWPEDIRYFLNLLHGYLYPREKL